MKTKRTSFKKLKEIAEFRRNRRASYISLKILRDVVAKSMPGQLVSFEHSAFSGSKLVVYRNSVNHPATYGVINSVRLQPEYFNLSTYDYTDRKGKLAARNRGHLLEDDMIKVLRSSVKQIDILTGYSEKVAATDKKLINVSEKKEGFTVTVLERDRFGRFLPGPAVDKDFPFFDLKFFKELASKNTGVRVLSRSESTAVV